MVGDSWPNEDFGLPDILRRSGVTVINISRFGGSNTDSLNQLYTQGLRVLAKDGFDCNRTKIYCFWTEWHRDFRPCDFVLGDLIDKSARDRYLEPVDLDTSLIDRYQHRMLMQFSNFAKTFGYEIEIIGGASDLYRFKQSDYSNLNLLCQSATNYVLEGDTFIDAPILSTCSMNFSSALDQLLHDRLKTYATIKDETQRQNKQDRARRFVLDVVTMAQQRRDTWRENPRWFPDQAHLNQQGYEILYDGLMRHAVLD